MILNLSTVSSEPLYAQIFRQIRARILVHDLRDDDPLPSIRELARVHRVSVITVQRAYADLEREGLIRSRPGKGFFVMAIPEGKKKEMAEERFAAALADLLAEALAEGLDRGRLQVVFERELREDRP